MNTYKTRKLNACVWVRCIYVHIGLRKAAIIIAHFLNVALVENIYSNTTARESQTQSSCKNNSEENSVPTVKMTLPIQSLRIITPGWSLSQASIRFLLWIAADWPLLETIQWDTLSKDSWKTNGLILASWDVSNRGSSKRRGLNKCFEKHCQYLPNTLASSFYL